MTVFHSHLSLMNATYPTLDDAKKVGRSNLWNPAPSEKGKQEAYFCLSLRDPLRQSLLEENGFSWSSRKVIEIKKAHYDQLKDPVSEVQFYESLIQHHVATRVQRFFQQAVLCYDTPYHFEIAETEGQYFSAPSLKVKCGKEKPLSLSYQAAHSSTIPALKACSRKDYEAGKTPKYFSFLKASHMENLDNSTVGLPIFVNQIDTLIDGKKDEGYLRTQTLELINQVAQAKITPNEATRKFLQAFQSNLITRPAEIKGEKKAKLEVIRLYQEEVAQLIEEASPEDSIEEPHPFFDPLYDINLANEKAEDIPVLRKILCNHKIKIIQEAQATEAKVYEVMLKNFPGSTKPAELHGARLAVLYSAKENPLLKTALSKLFCISFDRIEKDATLVNSLQQRCGDVKKDWKAIQTEISTYLDHFNRMEHCFKALMLQDLRSKLRGLTQAQFARRLKGYSQAHKVASIPSSQAAISRFENSRLHQEGKHITPASQRRLVITKVRAAAFSAILGVGKEHFTTSYFASKE